MEFGVQIGSAEFGEMKELAARAEALGFGVIMIPDHIVYEGPEKQIETSWLSYDAMVRAALILEATKRVQVGHLVLCNLFRHPAITAQGITSLDRLSGGRAFCGIGTGWTATEFAMTGIPYPDMTTRLEMLDEALTVMKALWSQERTTFAGRHYQLRGRDAAPEADAPAVDPARRRRQGPAAGRRQARRRGQHHRRGRRQRLHLHRRGRQAHRRGVPRQGALPARGSGAPRPRRQRHPHQQRRLHHHAHRIGRAHAAASARRWPASSASRPRRCRRRRWR